MTKNRASIFDSSDDFDVSGFQPKAEPEASRLQPDQVRAIAEASSFPSREARRGSEPDPVAQKPRREPRRHRTGRTAQFNARTTAETVEAFYAIADAKGWLVGETVERALAALQRELAAENAGQ